MDAASTLAVLVARYRWHLNYQRSRMRFHQQDGRLFWSSRRIWPGPRGAFLNLEAEISRPERFEAQRASLDHFLIERYVYYSLSRSGHVARGFVAHDPYRLVEARILGVRQSLTDAVGLSLSGPPVHALYSPGVSSTVYPPVPTERRSAGGDRRAIATSKSPLPALERRDFLRELGDHDR